MHTYFLSQRPGHTRPARIPAGPVGLRSRLLAEMADWTRRGSQTGEVRVSVMQVDEEQV